MTEDIINRVSHLVSIWLCYIYGFNSSTKTEKNIFGGDVTFTLQNLTNLHSKKFTFFASNTEIKQEKLNIIISTTKL